MPSLGSSARSRAARRPEPAAAGRIPPSPAPAAPPAARRGYRRSVPTADGRDDNGAIAVMEPGETHTAGAATPAPGWLGPDGGRRPLLGDVRNRVLVSFLVLLVVSTAASLLVLREVLFSRLGTEVQERLTEQVDSLRLLSETDPA